MKNKHTICQINTNFLIPNCLNVEYRLYSLRLKLCVLWLQWEYKGTELFGLGAQFERQSSTLGRLVDTVQPLWRKCSELLAEKSIAKCNGIE